MKLCKLPEGCDKFRAASILLTLQDTPHINAMLKREEKTALDIGCEIPVDLWDLYHDVGFSGPLRAFELKPLSKIIEIAKSHISEPSKLHLFESMSITTEFQLYKYYLQTAPIETVEHRKQLYDEEEYLKIFDLHFKKPWIYKYSNDLTYDYVIASNVFHLYSKHGVKDENPKVAEEINTDPERARDLRSEASAMLDKLIAKTNPNGAIYIKVQHEDHPYSIKYNHARFNDGILNDFIDDKLTKIYSGNIFENGILTSLVYLGKKKD